MSQAPLREEDTYAFYCRTHDKAVRGEEEEDAGRVYLVCCGYPYWPIFFCENPEKDMRGPPCGVGTVIFVQAYDSGPFLEQVLIASPFAGE